MLTDKEIFEIKEHLEKATNPLFFFDNDVDGLASFLLLARKYGKGKGVAIKSGPDLNASYARRLYELKPDYVFVLDKPLISKEFIEEVKNLNLPLIWIDHHLVDDSLLFKEGVYYYNSTKSKKDLEPTTYSCYKITGKDLWLAVAGCIADNYFPSFIKEFAEEYKELWGENIKSAFQALYETEIGRVTRMLNFALKDKTSNVVKMLKFLMKISSPLEIFDESNHIFLRFKQIDKKYQKLIEKAGEFAKNKLLYFQYGGDLSISSDIANRLFYKFPDKIIVVVYISGARANVSIRGKNAKNITMKAIEGLENATGGGHEEATGAKINVSDLPEFKRRIEGLIG